MFTLEILDFDGCGDRDEPTGLARPELQRYSANVQFLDVNVSDYIR